MLSNRATHWVLQIPDSDTFSALFLRTPSPLAPRVQIQHFFLCSPQQLCSSGDCLNAHSQKGGLFLWLLALWSEKYMYMGVIHTQKLSLVLDSNAYLTAGSHFPTLVQGLGQP